MMRILWSTFPLIRIAGVPIRAASVCLVHPVGLLLSLGWLDDLWRGVLVVLTLLVIAYGSLVIHELAHSFAARAYGYRTEGVLLFPLGCIAFLEETPKAAHELWIVAAGPCASTMLGTLLLLCDCGLAGTDNRAVFLVWSCCQFAWRFNFFVAVLNLIPCFPADGGRILRALLTLVIMRLRSPGSAEATLIATTITTRFVSWPLALALALLTVFWTHLWAHLLLLGLLIALGELELRYLRAEPAGRRPEPDVGAPLPGTATAVATPCEAGTLAAHDHSKGEPGKAPTLCAADHRDRWFQTMP